MWSLLCVTPWHSFSQQIQSGKPTPQFWSRASKHTNTHSQKKFTAWRCVRRCIERWRVHKQTQRNACSLRWRTLWNILACSISLSLPLSLCARAHTRTELLMLAAGFPLLEVGWQWFMTEGRSKGKQPTTGHQNKGRMSRRKGEKEKMLNQETWRDGGKEQRSSRHCKKRNCGYCMKMHEFDIQCFTVKNVLEVGNKILHKNKSQTDKHRQNVEDKDVCRLVTWAPGHNTTLILLTFKQHLGFYRSCPGNKHTKPIDTHTQTCNGNGQGRSRSSLWIPTESSPDLSCFKRRRRRKSVQDSETQGKRKSKVDLWLKIGISPGEVGPLTLGSNGAGSNCFQWRGCLSELYTANWKDFKAARSQQTHERENLV